MKVIRTLPLAAWLLLAGTTGAVAQDAPASDVALVGATIIDGTGAAPVANGVVIARDGRIACVGTRAACAVPGDVATIDVTGRWIMPGIVDAHVHYSQTGWADGRPDAEDVREAFPYDSTMAHLERHPERFFRSYLCSGVTSTFDVGGYPWTWALRRRAEPDNAAPRVAAAGPLLSTRDHWLNLPAARQFVHTSSDSATRAGARMAARYESDAVKVWYLVSGQSADTAVHQARLRTAAEEARAAGIPLIVHATNLWAAKDALRAGARLLVHSVEDREVDDEFLRLARESGAVYTPTLTVYEGYMQLARRAWDPAGVPLECVDPDTRAKAALTDGRPPRPLSAAAQARYEARRRTIAANLLRVHEAGIPVAMGTDAGNPLTLHGASVFNEMEAMAAAGMAPMAVLESATRVAARAMGREDVGTLEPGRHADLLVLDADPLADVRNLRTVRLVVRGGEVWTRAELEYR